MKKIAQLGLVVGLMLAFIPASTADTSDTLAFLVVSNDSSLNSDTLNEVTEVVAFEIKRRLGMKVISKERFAHALRYRSPQNAGPCFSHDIVSDACVRSVVKKQNVGAAVILKLVRDGAPHHYLLYFHHVSSKGAHTARDRHGVDLSKTGKFVKTASNYVIEQLEKVYRGTLKLNVWPKNARVAINGKAVELRGGRIDMTLKPGGYMVHVSADSRVDYDVTVRLSAGQIMNLGIQLKLKGRTSARSQREPRRSIVKAQVVENTVKHVYRWSALGSSVTALSLTVAAIVVGLQAKDIEAEINRCASEPCLDLRGQKRAKLIQEGENKTATANVLASVAGVMATTAAVLYILSEFEEDTIVIMPVLSIEQSGNGASVGVSVPF